MQEIMNMIFEEEKKILLRLNELRQSKRKKRGNPTKQKVLLKELPKQIELLEKIKKSLSTQAPKKSQDVDDYVLEFEKQRGIG